MSAFICNPNHLRLLVEYAGRPGHDHSGPLSWYVNDKRFEVSSYDDAECDRLMASLWRENVKSVRYRYDDADAVWDNLEDVPTFRGNVRIPPDAPKVWLFKALDCYEYQSCEHPEWEQSEAHAFCVAFRKRLIHQMPGYDDAPTWEWSGDPILRSVKST